MQKLKKMVAYADTHFEKPFLILGLVAMILIICYQTLYRYLITFLIQFVGDPSNAWMIAPFCDPLALKNTISASLSGRKKRRAIFLSGYRILPFLLRSESAAIYASISFMTGFRIGSRLQAGSSSTFAF